MDYKTRYSNRFAIVPAIASGSLADPSRHHSILNRPATKINRCFLRSGIVIFEEVHMFTFDTTKPKRLRPLSKTNFFCCKTREFISDKGGGKTYRQCLPPLATFGKFFLFEGKIARRKPQARASRCSAQVRHWVVECLPASGSPRTWHPNRQQNRSSYR